LPAQQYLRRVCFLHRPNQALLHTEVNEVFRCFLDVGLTSKKFKKLTQNGNNPHTEGCRSNFEKIEESGEIRLTPPRSA
jgi:hypothetical protein